MACSAYGITPQALATGTSNPIAVNTMLAPVVYSRAAWNIQAVVSPVSVVFVMSRCYCFACGSVDRRIWPIWIVRFAEYITVCSRLSGDGWQTYPRPPPDSPPSFLRSPGLSPQRQWRSVKVESWRIAILVRRPRMKKVEGCHRLLFFVAGGMGRTPRGWTCF